MIAIKSKVHMRNLALQPVLFDSPDYFEGPIISILPVMWRLGHKDAFLRFWYQNRDKIDRKKLKTRKNEKNEKRTATLLLDFSGTTAR